MSGRWRQMQFVWLWRPAFYTDLTVDVGAGVEQHLNHGLITAYAGVHERGHSLQEEERGGHEKTVFLKKLER